MRVGKVVLANLSRRERQIMDALYERGRASVADVQESLPEPPGYSAVRALVRILEDKGHVRHELDGHRYVYLPSLDREKVRQTALRHVVRTFFDGSASQAMAALLDPDAPRWSEDELKRPDQFIQNVRKEGA